MVACGADDGRNANELIRQTLSAIRSRLLDGGYGHLGQFIADLDAVDAALGALGAENLARRDIRPLRQKASVFGFRTVTLDVRQNSGVTTSALESIWGATGAAPAFGTPAWSARLRFELANPALSALDANTLTEEARELLALLALMNEARQGADPKAIGPFILSMTRSTDDILGV